MGIRIGVALAILAPFFILPERRPLWQSLLIALVAFAAGRLVEELDARPHEDGRVRASGSPVARVVRAIFWLVLGGACGAGLVYFWNLFSER